MKSFWYSRVSLTYSSYCILHQYVFPGLLPFRYLIRKKTATNIRAGSPLRVVTSYLMMLRRRPFPSAYSGFGWFRQAHEDRDILCPGFWSEFSCRALWHSFRLEDLPIHVGSVRMRKKSLVSHFMCLFFVLLNLSASFWSTLNVAKQWLLYNDRRWVQVVFYLHPPWKSQHRQPKYKILVSFFCFSRLNEPDSSQFSIQYHLNFLGDFFLLQLSIFHWMTVSGHQYSCKGSGAGTGGTGMQVSIVDIYKL